MYYIYFINEIINKIKLSNFSKKQSKCYKCSHVGVHFINFFYEKLGGFVRRYRLQRKASLSTLTITMTITVFYQGIGYWL